MFHQPIFKKMISAGLNSLREKEYQISVKNGIFEDPCHKKGLIMVILGARDDQTIRSIETIEAVEVTDVTEVFEAAEGF